MVHHRSSVRPKSGAMEAPDLANEVVTVMMKITEIRVSLRDDDKLKAFVSMTLDSCFVIRGMKIISGNKGLFVAMPSRRKPDGTYQDLAHPINNQTRAWIEEEILERYKQELEKNALVK